MQKTPTETVIESENTNCRFALVLKHVLTCEKIRQRISIVRHTDKVYGYDTSAIFVFRRVIRSVDGVSCISQNGVGRICMFLLIFHELQKKSEEYFIFPISKRPRKVSDDPLK